MPALIPRDFIERLVSRTDLVEVIDSRVPLRKAGREYVACCPFHNEKTPSFSVSPAKQFYHCFGCGAHGNAISFLMEYEHLGFPDAVEELARTAGMEVPRDAAGPAVDEQAGLLETLARADRFFRRQLREHPTRARVVDYLKSRGLTGETVAAFGIGYAPPGWDNLIRHLEAPVEQVVAAGLAVEREGGGYDRFRDRVVFPIRDRRGRTIAFGARLLGEGTPKYLNSAESPVFHKGRELYGLYEARTARRQIQRLVVVEGYMDVVALAQHGIRYAVATLGTATTREHVERLFGITRDVSFCFDGDRAGRAAAWRALENTLPLLRDGRQASFLFLPEGEDPDTVVRREGRGAFEARLDDALPLSDFLFQHLAGTVDTTSLDGRARLAEQARPLLERLPDSLYRDMMLQRLATLTGVDRETLGRRLHPTPASTPPAPARGLARTPVRTAIALLLGRPALAESVTDLASLSRLDAPGVALLAELIEIFQRNPDISVGVVLERYRGGPHHAVLERLAGWTPEIPNGRWQAEFLDIVHARLGQLYNPTRALLDRLARGEALSAEEREALRNLSQAGEIKG